MAACRVWLMAGTGFVLLLLTATEAFKWTSDIQDGENLLSCVGDNVTFPWSYVTESEENVIVQFWFSNRSGSFASYFADHFMTSWNRVTQAGPAGVTLSDVITADDDTYGINVMLNDGQEALAQHITLAVAEPPRTTDGQLHVSKHAMGAGNASRPHMRLKCGEFLTRGSPPVSVVWTDPLGHRLLSTTFHDGYFHLDLDPHARGGNYTCSVQREAEATHCLASDSPLLMAAGYRLVTMETTALDQGAELRQLRRTLEELSQQVALSHVTHTNTSGALWHTVTTLEQGQSNRTGVLEGQVAELHNTNVQQNRTVNVLVNQVADLQDTSTELRQAFDEQNSTVSTLVRQAADQDTQIYRVHNVVSELQTKNADLSQASRDQSEQISSLQNQLSALHSTVLELRQASLDQNTQISSLQKQVTDQNAQVSVLQKQNTDQNIQISSLQKQVSDQNTPISSLGKQVLDQNSQISGIQNQNANQSTQISGLQKQVSDQNTQISGLQKQVSDQNTQISSMQNQVSDQNTQISSLRSDLQKVNSDQKKADVDLKDDLTRNLTLVTSQMTDMATLLQDSQLQASQDNLASAIQAGTRQVTSLQNSVTALQADVSRGQTTLTMFQSDITKLKTFSSQVSKLYSNVAAYKPAAQSSTYPHSKSDAGLAVDLNLNTDFRQGSCTHTSDGELNPWWRVDLGHAYEVTVVLITNRGDCCGNRLKDFYVDVLNDDPVSNSTATAVTCFHYTDEVGGGVTLTLQCSKPTRGRYVRVRMSTELLQLCEVQVMAPVASWTP